MGTIILPSGKKISSDQIRVGLTLDKTVKKFICKYCENTYDTPKCARCKIVSCTFCEEKILSLNSFKLDSSVLCASCFREKCGYCTRCEKRIWREKSILVFTGELFCSKDCFKSFSFKKYSHNFKCFPVYIFRSKPYEGPYYGIEMEFACSEITQTKYPGHLIHKTDGFLYCVHDGSIQSGLEIVAQPMNWNYFEKQLYLFKELFNDKLLSVNNNCGLHIHIDRKSFIDKTHEFRFNAFFFTNRDFIYSISGRTNYNWWKRYADPNLEIPISDLIHRKEKPNRHGLINTTPHTLELRFFAMPDNFQRFFSCLLFAKKTFEWTRDNTNLQEVLNIDNFLPFLGATE